MVWPGSLLYRIIQVNMLRLFLLFPALLMAQDSAHWGVQGDYFVGTVPEGLVEQIDDLPEVPTIDAKGYNAGIVRFKANGAPSWSIEFSRTQMNFFGGREVSGVRGEITGNALLRGGMVTKFWNFFSNRYVSAGIATGAGAAQAEGSYLRYAVTPGAPVIIGESDTFDRIVPIFQAVAQVDIRPVRWISLSPFYGMRNGALGGGGAIRIHFTR